MFHWSSNFLMVFGAIAFHPICSAVPHDFNCHKFSTVCNDMEAARICKMLDFCADQAAACSSIDYLQRGATALFGSILDDAMFACNDRYTAFKRPTDPILWPSRKIVNIKVEMDEDQSPFSVRFDFHGHNVSLYGHAEPKVAITLNDKVIRDYQDNKTIKKKKLRKRLV